MSKNKARRFERSSILRINHLQIKSIDFWAFIAPKMDKNIMPNFSGTLVTFYIFAAVTKMNKVLTHNYDYSFVIHLVNAFVVALFFHIGAIGERYIRKK